MDWTRQRPTLLQFRGDERFADTPTAAGNIAKLLLDTIVEAGKQAYAPVS
jgi:hypothetical protein